VFLFLNVAQKIYSISEITLKGSFNYYSVHTDSNYYSFEILIDKLFKYVFQKLHSQDCFALHRRGFLTNISPNYLDV